MSRIWKPCGSAASFQCARRKRLHRPWKVPIHMPRTFTGSIADSRVSISLAALLVKVTAITPPGDTWPVCSSQAMRVVSTRVLPEPAPARISAGSRRQRHGGELFGVQVLQQRRGQRRHRRYGIEGSASIACRRVGRRASRGGSIGLGGALQHALAKARLASGRAASAAARPRRIATGPKFWRPVFSPACAPPRCSARRHPDQVKRSQPGRRTASTRRLALAIRSWKSSTTTTSCCCRASAASTAARECDAGVRVRRPHASTCRWCRPT